MNTQVAVPPDLDVDSIYGSKRLKAADIPLGKKLGLTINGVFSETMPDKDGQPGKKRLVLSFVETEKQMVLNVTNNAVLTANLGPRAFAWTGARVVVERQMVSYAGASVPGLRITKAVRPGEPRQATLPATASVATDDAFVASDEDLAFLND